MIFNEKVSEKISEKKQNAKTHCLSGFSLVCGEYRTRTDHLLHAMQALYQMS